MGSGCRKTISWKNYYIKLKPGSLKTIFNFMILIFASRNGTSSRAPANVHILPLGIQKALRHFCPENLRPGQSSRLNPGAAFILAPVCPGWTSLTAMGWLCALTPEPGTLAHKLSDPSSAPGSFHTRSAAKKKKMGRAHKSLLHMVTKNKQVNKFSNAFLRPGIINTLSCYHDWNHMMFQALWQMNLEWLQ